MSKTNGSVRRLGFSLNTLLVFLPIAVYLEYIRPQAHTLIFFAACLAIILVMSNLTGSPTCSSWPFTSSWPWDSFMRQPDFARISEWPYAC